MNDKEFRRSNVLDEKAEDFFVMQKFVANKLANYLSKLYNFVTLRDTDEIFYFNGKYYIPAETIIKEECKSRLKDESNQRRINEVVFLIKCDTYKERSSPDPNLIFFENGVYDLKEKSLLDHNSENFITSVIPVYFKKEAKCDTFLSFLSQVIYEGDVKTIQEMFGYCLFRDYKFQNAFMFLGQGSNGKSTLLFVLQKLLGESNVSSVPLQSFEDRFSVSQLYAKLANIYPDLSDSSLKNTGMFKALCAGDTVQIEKKFSQPFNFSNYAKIIFSCNKLPETSDESEAFFRRWIYFLFPNTFEKEKANTDLRDRLTTAEELSGILNWSLEGLYRLLERKRFETNLSTESSRNFYQRMSSPIKAFLMDCIQEDTSSWIKKSTLYSAFTNYCRKNKLPCLSEISFALKLKQNIYVEEERRTVDQVKGVRVWTNIKLATTVDVTNSTTIPNIPYISPPKEGEKNEIIGGGEGGLSVTQEIEAFILSNLKHEIEFILLWKRWNDAFGAENDDICFKIFSTLKERGVIFNPTSETVKIMS